MKWPRVRFTIRRLMVAVAILAVAIRAVLWIGDMRRLSNEYALRAFRFSTVPQRMFNSKSFAMTKDGRWVNRNDDENDWLRDAGACKLAEKYWRLSDYPWLPVEPDPPPPQPIPHPRPAVDLPAEMDCRCQTPMAERPPRWTFLWAWRRWN